MRVLTLVNSGRAWASSYPGPHVQSRGPHLLLLLMFLTCFLTRSDGGATGLSPPPSVTVSAACQVASIWKSPRGRNLLLLQQMKWRNTSTWWLLDLTCVRSIAKSPVAASLHRSVSDSRVKTYFPGLLACGYEYLLCITFGEKTTPSRMKQGHISGIFVNTYLYRNILLYLWRHRHRIAQHRTQCLELRGPILTAQWWVWGSLHYSALSYLQHSTGWVHFKYAKTHTHTHLEKKIQYGNLKYAHTHILYVQTVHERIQHTIYRFALLNLEAKQLCIYCIVIFYRKSELPMKSEILHLHLQHVHIPVTVYPHSAALLKTHWCSSRNHEGRSKHIVLLLWWQDILQSNIVARSGVLTNRVKSKKVIAFKCSQLPSSSDREVFTLSTHVLQRTNTQPKYTALYTVMQHKLKRLVY